jgi:hypothetical protein
LDGDGNRRRRPTNADGNGDAYSHPYPDGNRRRRQTDAHGDRIFDGNRDGNAYADCGAIVHGDHCAYSCRDVDSNLYSHIYCPTDGDLNAGALSYRYRCAYTDAC